jgi:hypothetical protein
MCFGQECRGRLVGIVVVIGDFFQAMLKGKVAELIQPDGQQQKLPGPVVAFNDPTIPS